MALLAWLCSLSLQSAESAYNLAASSVAQKSCGPDDTEELSTCGHRAWRESQCGKSKTLKQSSDESPPSSSLPSLLLLLLPFPLPSTTSCPKFILLLLIGRREGTERLIYQSHRRSSVDSNRLSGRCGK